MFSFWSFIPAKFMTNLTPWIRKSVDKLVASKVCFSEQNMLWNLTQKQGMEKTGLLLHLQGRNILCGLMVVMWNIWPSAWLWQLAPRPRERRGTNNGAGQSTAQRGWLSGHSYSLKAVHSILVTESTMLTNLVIVSCYENSCPLTKWIYNNN